MTKGYAIGVWLRWVFANALSVSISITIIRILPLIFFFPFYLKPSVVGFTMEGLLVGLIMGFIQAIALLTMGLSPDYWVRTSAIGIGLGLGAIGFGFDHFIATINPNDVLNNAFWGLAGLVIGLTVGIVQFLSVRRLSRQAGWWILSNAGGWSLGFLLGWSSTPSSHPEWNPWFPVTIIGIIASSVTGLGLIWALHHQISD